MIKMTEIIHELEAKGQLKKGLRTYNQTGDNCLEVANHLARNLGYIPLSRQELSGAISASKTERLWPSNLPQTKSDAFLVIRTPDNPTQVHVTFEYQNQEYNFGPDETDGFSIDLKIPLRRAS